MKRLVPISIVLCLALTAPSEASQASADYSFTLESIDGGGLTVASMDYTSDGSASPGNFVASEDYVQRGGYIGQLHNALVVVPYTIQRGSNSIVRIPLDALTNSVTEPDGDTVSVASWSSVTGQGGSITELDSRFLQYESPTNYNGNDTAFWTALDSEGDEAQGTILLRIATPTDGPTLNLISLNVVGAQATLIFAGFPQTTYETQVQVQYTDSLLPANWQNLGVTVVTNGILTIVDPSGGSISERFYRTVYPTP